MALGTLDLQALELLVEVDERGSLSAAARELRMAQPNASRAIGRLERRLGVTLLTRSTSGSRLTAQGTVLVHWARETLAGAQQFLDVAAGLRGERATELTVAASLTVAEHLMPRWLGRFAAEYPETAVHLQVQNSAGVVDLLTGGACDVGFVESPTVPAGLHSAVVAADELVLVVPPDHPWARRRRPVTVDELAATPLLAREPGSGTRETLDSALDGFARAAPLLELGSSAAITTAVADGIGPAVLSTLATATAVATGAVRTLPVRGLRVRRQLRAVWRPPRELTGPPGDLVRLAVGS
ncbi:MULTISPECIES: LysR family transcriptional regulator [unclassified Gordonia (in: high G+C Gram-positive bacteria)]|uniref:LysR family transcriptional regulator n=1 Tax=unclassified Gordonia (in: high G+C Gram-positive bacteria) TaxID=2657482 RepID=UPI001FFFF46C|nr:MULTISPECIES: LysR family transcriptional regulator [unclassified Gordonia (in: high G+C Gram-positive bacteria)]UQE75265.1 LysR family transcriptional regulator [Gordonia sp. PP30]